MIISMSKSIYLKDDKSEFLLVNVDEVIRSSDRNLSISESERRPDAYQPSCGIIWNSILYITYII